MQFLLIVMGLNVAHALYTHACGARYTMTAGSIITVLGVNVALHDFSFTFVHVGGIPL